MCTSLNGEVTRKLPRGVSAHSERKWRRVFSIGKYNCIYRYDLYISKSYEYISIDTVILLHVVDNGEPRCSLSGTSSPVQYHIFEASESESEVRIESVAHNFLLTSKTCFSAFIFFQAQFCSKNSEKIHRGVFY